MNADHSQWLDNFDRMACEAGVCAWGIIAAHPVDERVHEAYGRWVDKGCNASMDYLRRHVALKAHLENVLPGCQSIVSIALPYPHSVRREEDVVIFSRHSLVADYHKSLRKLLKPLTDFIENSFGGSTRICVDSAPVAERYWAVRCGLGRVGRNGLLYVPGYGSWVFLAEILATAKLSERKQADSDWRLRECDGCNRCVESCPGKAIMGDGLIDCRRCRAYLTIESPDVRLPDGVTLGKRIFGCDICQEVCPLNNEVAPYDGPLHQENKLKVLTLRRLATMTEDEFAELARGTQLKRAGLARLRRNSGR